MREYSYIKRALLRELSENSRISVTNLAKRLKCSRNTIISNIDFLEKEFGLFYTLEFNKKRLGFIQNQVWNIKFGIKPKTSEIEAIFKDDNAVQFIAKTEGDFDLVIKIFSDTSETYIKWGIKTVQKLLEYRPIIKPSFIAMVHSGFFPIGNGAIKQFDEKLIGLDRLDKKIIMLLNENSRISYAAMARDLGEDVETIRYRIKKLTKMDLIKRFTVLMKKPPVNYGIAFFVNYELSPGLSGRYDEAYRYYLNLDRGLPVMNRFQYLALTSGSNMFFGMGCFENEENAISEAIISHKQIYDNDKPDIIYAKITKIIKGYLPIRNLDLEKEYVPIKWSL